MLFAAEHVKRAAYILKSMQSLHHAHVAVVTACAALVWLGGGEWHISA